MLTVVYQCLAALLALTFGLVALGVATALEGQGERRAAGWRLTGLAFALHGTLYSLHTSAAALAFLAGAGSAPYVTYLRVAPVGNHARSFLILAFSLLLAWFVWRRPEPGGWLRRAAVMLVAAAAAGAVFGAVEGELRYGPHFTTVSLFGVLILLALLASLAGAASGAVDRLLWLSLAFYALHQVQSVLWNSMAAWREIVGWAPSPRHLTLSSAVLYGAMLVLGALALRSARAGRRIPELFGAGDRAPIRLIG